jgi:hypothetical protein
MYCQLVVFVYNLIMNDMGVKYDELGRTVKEVALTYFSTLLQHLSGATEVNHRKCQPG